MRHTVRAFIVTLVTLCVAAIWGVLTLLENRAGSERVLAEKQAELSRIISLLTQSAEDKFGPDVARNDFPAWSRAIGRLGPYRLSLIDADGRLLGDSLLPPEDMEYSDNHALRPEITQALAEGRGVSRRYSATLRCEYLYVAGRLTFRRAPDDPAMILRLGLPSNLISAERGRILRQYAVTGGLAVLAAFLVSLAAAGPLNRQIEELVAAARDLAGGNLSRRIVRHPKNELGFLGVALNRLASRFSRQAASEKLSALRFLTILENIDDGILVTDRDGNIIHANDALVRLFCLTLVPTGRPGEVIRETAIIESLKRAAAGEDQPPLSLKLSSGRFVEVRFISLTDGGNPAGMAAIFLDFTDSRRLYLQRRQILETISHELEIPLGALASAAEALREKTAGDEELRPIADLLAGHEGKLDEMSRDLRELLRLEALKARRLPLKRKTMAWDGLIREALQSLKTAPEEADRFNIQIAPEARIVSGDEAALLTAVRNLIDNALKYSRAGTSINVTSVTEPNGGSSLAVASQGAPLSPEDLDRVFERFYRGERGRRAHRAGAGLGLALVKHAAQAHDGQAWVESTPGGGNVFTISIPQAKAGA